MEVSPINARLAGLLECKPVLVMAHRGSVGANIVDNTPESFDAAIQSGADIVEADVFKSRDGELFVFHDGTEPLMLGRPDSVLSMDGAALRSQRYVNRNLIRLNRGISTLDALLEHLKGRVLINLDRCWDCWQDVFTTVERHGMADQILFKSPVSQRYLDVLAAQTTRYMYMPIVWTRDEVARTLAYPINTVAVEFIGYREDASIMDGAFIHSLREQGIQCMVSALTLGNPVMDGAGWSEDCRRAGSRMADALLGDNILLAGGHDDDTSVLGNPDEGWGWLVRRGFNILQTDWALHLHTYLQRTDYAVTPWTYSSFA